MLLMLIVSEAGVLVVSGPVWESLYAEEPKNPVFLEVVGKQFEWYIRYPGKDGKFGESDLKRVNETDNLFGLDDFDDAAQDDIIKRGQICLPVGRPVVLRLRTYDVIHSFFVPEFRVKQDLLPGYPTRLKFTPMREGEFDLACAELCGLTARLLSRGESAPGLERSRANCRRMRLNSVGLQSSISVLRTGLNGVSRPKSAAAGPAPLLTNPLLTEP